MSNLNQKIISQLIKDCKTQKDFFGEHRLIKNFVTAVMKSALKAALTIHLGYAKHNHAGYNAGNFTI